MLNNILPGSKKGGVVSFVLVNRDIINNKVFYQHPDLMRTLGMHETVMEVMVNVLGEGESKVRNVLTSII